MTLATSPSPRRAQQPMSESTVDAVVIGAGINGMVAAAELAGAGWSVALVDGRDRLGGFIGSAERTIPGYVHDTWSSYHTQFVTGAAYASLGADLHRHGLEYANTDGAITASVADGGHATVAYRNPDVTAAEFASDTDRFTYLAQLASFGQHAGAVGGLIGGELRTPRALRHIAALLGADGLGGTERLLRDLATSGRAFTRREYQGEEVDHLWVPWLLHAGLSPDHASGGFLLPAFAASMHLAGTPVVVGGSERFVEAFAALLTERDVQQYLQAPVEQILLEGGRAVGVLAGDQEIRARRAVLASVTPTDLYDKLLPPGSVRKVVHEDARTFRYGRAAMQLHVALRAPLRWTDTRLRDVPLVHLSDGSPSTGIACAQAEAGLLPARPTVVVGQQHLLDPTRVPPGAAALWLQLQEVPYRPRGDAAGELDTSAGWTPALATGYAERILDRLGQHAPGLRDDIVGIDILTPDDLAGANPNALQGDIYAGANDLDQSYLWRPLASNGKHRTDIPGLWHIGASTHPGGGLGGASGHSVASTLTPKKPT